MIILAPFGPFTLRSISGTDACDVAKPCAENDTCIAVKATKKCKLSESLVRGKIAVLTHLFVERIDKETCSVDEIESGMSRSFGSASQSRQLLYSMVKDRRCKDGYYCHRAHRNSTWGVCKRIPWTQFAGTSVVRYF